MSLLLLLGVWGELLLLGASPPRTLGRGSPVTRRLSLELRGPPLPGGGEHALQTISIIVTTIIITIINAIIAIIIIVEVVPIVVWSLLQKCAHQP